MGIVFLAHFGPINTNESLNSTACLSIVSDCVLPFMATVYHLLKPYMMSVMIMHHATGQNCLKLVL